MIIANDLFYFSRKLIYISEHIDIEENMSESRKPIEKVKEDCSTEDRWWRGGDMFCIKDVQKHLSLFAKIEPTNFKRNKTINCIGRNFYTYDELKMIRFVEKKRNLIDLSI